MLIFSSTSKKPRQLARSTVKAKTLRRKDKSSSTVLVQELNEENPKEITVNKTANLEEPNSRKEITVELKPTAEFREIVIVSSFLRPDLVSFSNRHREFCDFSDQQLCLCEEEWMTL